MVDKKKVSQDNFYKKVSSSKAFSIQSKAETYSTIIQMLKSDLFLLQDMINENSSEIKMHKLLSKIPALTKKLSEIEDSQDLKALTDQITEDSGNIERLGKIYGCKNTNELCQKLALELNFYELFVKKLSDYFLLIQLKHCSKTFQDSLSKILPIKSLMDNLLQKIKNPDESSPSSHSKVDMSGSNNSNLQSSINDNPKIKEYDSLIGLSTFNEVLDSKGESGPIFKHIHSLVNDYFNNLNQNVENMLKQLAIQSIHTNPNSNSPIDHFFDNQKLINDVLNKNKEDIAQLMMTNESNANKLKLQMEDESTQRLTEIRKQYDVELNNQNEKIKQLQLELNANPKVADDILSKNDDLIKEINDNKTKFTIEKDKMRSDNLAEVNRLKTEIEALNKERNKMKDIESDNQQLKKSIAQTEKENKSNPTSTPTPTTTQVNQSTVNEVLELIQSRNREFELFKKESTMTYENKITNLTTKLNTLTEMNNIITIENRDLKKKLDTIQNKKFDSDSYEQVLLGQFDTMRNAFTKKIAELTDELSKNENESRVKMYSLKEELKEANNLKDVFLKQVLQLQKHLNIN